MKSPKNNYAQLTNPTHKTPYQEKISQEFKKMIENGVPMNDLLNEVKIQNSKIQVNYDSGQMEQIVTLHSHSFYEILFVSEGNAEYILGTQRYHIHEGDIVFLRPGTSHCPLNRLHSKSIYRRYSLWLDAGIFQNICNLYSDVGQTFERCQEQNCYLLRSSDAGRKKLNTELTYIRQEMEQCRPGYELFIVASALKILGHISRTYLPVTDEEISRSDDSLFDNILCYIDEHLREKITLDQIAEYFHVSTSTISHSFRQNMDTSFYRCVLQKRLLEAKRMIFEGIPLKQVSDECGFSDYSAFYRLFKKEFGLGPREFIMLHHPK